jgi:hypothetical protein
MYDFQIMMQPRVLTPADGQAKLAQMFAEIKKNEASAAPGVNTLKMEGVTSHDNPFPNWLYQWISKIPGVQFDTINFMFWKRCKTRQEAEAFKQWVSNLKDWAQANDQQKFADFERLVVNILDVSADEIKHGQYDTY